MFKVIIFFLFLLLLTACQESGAISDALQKSREITIKNSIAKAARESVDLIVSGETGEKLYANSKLIKSFEKSEDANISLTLEGEDGLKEILLELEDSSGNSLATQKLRIYKDTTAPKVELLGESRIEIPSGSEFQDPGVKVSDNIDKNITVVTSGDLNSSQVGNYTIEYNATDSAGNSAKEQRVVVVVDAKNFNFAPVVTAKESKESFLDNQEFYFDLNNIFSDKNGDKLQFTIKGLPDFLTLLDDGTISGKLPSSASVKAPYRVEVTATDSGGKSATTTVEFQVKNSAPIAKDDNISFMNRGKAKLLDLLINDSDPDGDAIELVSILSLPKHGKARIVDNKIEYLVDANFTGVDSLRYSIKDSDGATAVATATIRVKEYKDIPLIYLSQDTWDRDNYSLIAAAKKLHQRELIDLRAVDITGKDAGNKVSNVFRAILGSDVDIPVLINHSFYGRLTPTTSRFPELDRFVDTIILDSEALDSTDYILSDLEGIDRDQRVVYVVGGHLHNFASLLLQDADLVNEKVDRIVISTGWEDRISGKPEMNLSEGVYKETSTSKATKIVFSKFKGEIVMASDPDANYPVLDTSKMDRTSALWYFISHGKYNDLQLHIGDFEALLYGAVEDSWYGHHWVDKKEARCSVTNYGAVKLSGSGVRCFYLDNMNSYYTKAVLEELLYRED